MAEKPILFSTSMVQAILRGDKKQTRRLITPQPLSRLCYCFAGSSGSVGTWGYPDINAWNNWGEKYRLPDGISPEEKARRWKNPCKADDFLWVRETWNYGFVESEYRECAPSENWFEEMKPGEDTRYLPSVRYWYKADADDQKAMTELHGRWRPSIHMPRSAARIFLKVKCVRMQRLQEIADYEARLEGVTCAEGEDPRREFAALWTRLAPEGMEWLDNPWVWVIEFERLSDGGGEDV